MVKKLIIYTKDNRKLQYYLDGDLTYINGCLKFNGKNLPLVEISSFDVISVEFEQS